MRTEAELPVELLCIAREQIDPAARERRMFENRREQPFSQALAPAFILDDHVTQVPDCRVIRDNPGETDLAIPAEESEV
jgi:hypothetical protein